MQVALAGHDGLRQLTHVRDGCGAPVGQAGHRLPRGIRLGLAVGTVRQDQRLGTAVGDPQHRQAGDPAGPLAAGDHRIDRVAAHDAARLIDDRPSRKPPAGVIGVDKRLLHVAHAIGHEQGDQWDLGAVDIPIRIVRVLCVACA